MPSMTAENCAMISGFSGLPKFKQLVAATGVAPAQATLRAASATECMAPSFGSRYAQRLAIERHGQPALGPLHADHAGIVAGRLRRVGLHHGVVLLVHPAFGADIRRR